MNAFIDRDAGFATFRKGRSVCLRLDGRLDLDKASGIERQVRHDNDAVRLRLECSSLRHVDPAAARVLARAVLAWIQRRDDRSVDVLNLDQEIQGSSAWVPLRAATDADALFFDPDPDPDWADPARPSRH